VTDTAAPVAAAAWLPVWLRGCLQDMFVDFDLAQGTAGSIKGIRQVGYAAAAAAAVLKTCNLLWTAARALRPYHMLSRQA
jgi:hypothetical protein